MPDPLGSEFWANEESEMWDVLSPLFISTVTDAVEGGIFLLPEGLEALVDFDAVNQMIIDYVKAYKFEWIHAISDTTRSQVQQAFSEWIASGDSLRALEAQLSPLFGSVRAELIASTEVTRIFAEANQMAWNSTGYVGGKQWNTARDERVCPICSPLDGQVVLLNNAFPSDIGGGFVGPPAHPRCRCWLSPVVDVGAAIEQAERILQE